MFRDEDEDSNGAAMYDQTDETTTDPIKVLLGVALSSRKLGLGSAEFEINSALTAFGLPLPFAQVSMMEGLESNDQFQWLNAYRALEDYMIGQKDRIKLDQADDTMGKLLDADHLDRTKELLNQFIGFDITSHGDWLSILNGLLHPSREASTEHVNFQKPDLPPTHKFARVPKKIPPSKPPQTPTFENDQSDQAKQYKKEIASHSAHLQTPERVRQEGPAILKEVQKLPNNDKRKDLQKLLSFLTGTSKSAYPSSYKNWESKSNELYTIITNLNNYYMHSNETMEDRRETIKAKIDQLLDGREHGPTELILDLFQNWYLPIERGSSEDVGDEKQEQVPTKSSFDIPYEKDDLRVRITGTLEMIWDPNKLNEWIPRPYDEVEKKGKFTYKFMNDWKPFHKKLQTLGWNVNQNVFSTWFSAMKQKVLKARWISGEVAYKYLRDSLVKETDKWVSHDAIQADPKLIDYWLHRALTDIPDFIQRHIDFYKNPEWHEEGVRPDSKNSIEKILKNIPNVGAKPPPSGIRNNEIAHAHWYQKGG